MNSDMRSTTIEAAVRVLLDIVPADQQAVIRSSSEEDLIQFHVSLGAWVRNHFGLWDHDSNLLRATGERHPDDAAMVIVRAFWQRLRETAPRPH